MVLLTFLLGIPCLIINVQSSCDYPETLKPPFLDDGEICSGSGDGDTISGIFAIFESQLTSDVEQFQSDDSVMSGWAECLSDDYVTDFCDDCVDHSLSWAEEGPLDVAFWSLFEEVTTLDGTEEIHCVDDHTIESSLNVTAKLPGVPTPISWRATFQMAFDDDGLVTKFVDQTQFQRHLYSIFYALLIEDGATDSDQDDEGGNAVPVPVNGATDSDQDDEGGNA